MSTQTTTATKRQILVIGATGRVGSQTINELARYYSDQFYIVAGVRSKSEKAREQRHWAGRTRVIYIDAEEPTSLAFNNIDILFIIPRLLNNLFPFRSTSSRQDHVKHVKAYVDAAIQNKMSFNLLSIVLPRDENILFAKQFNEMENYVATCNIPNCFLRCGYFQHNFLLQADDNVIRLPINAGHMSPLNVIDVARAACSIFTDPQVHAGKSWHLFGLGIANFQIEVWQSLQPRGLNGDGIAKAASKGLGREIIFANVS
ncbi:hypothetical protein BC938DRAFT_478119 [Jimgerdemannia flammicorona]|uniref:NmrA-like domain-containing protein n=1 Tax=Jimgerdemannia flammicorona TaxID=994334 RepID=A0A433QYM2_9FUNG|nr:hypothetical protein BC938DRAFT_478119 [Jimgerdemannia flammicorona]